MPEVKELIQKFKIVHRNYNVVKFDEPYPIKDAEWEALARVALEFCKARDLTHNPKYAQEGEFSPSGMNLEEIKARAEGIFAYTVEIDCKCKRRIRVLKLVKGILTVKCDECDQGCDIEITSLTDDIPALIAEVERLNKENLSFHAQATEYYEETVRLKEKRAAIRTAAKAIIYQPIYYLVQAQVDALAEAIKEV